MKTRLILTFHHARQLSAPLHTSESGPTPDTPGDQLEPPFTSQFNDTLTSRRNSRSRGNLFPGSGNTDDSRDAPSFVARLESSTHDVDLLRRGIYRQESFSLSEPTHVPRGIKCVVKPTVCDLDKVILDTLAFG